MRFHGLILAVLLTLTSLAWVQEAPSSLANTPISERLRRPNSDAQPASPRNDVQVEAMKADVEKMKSSLAQMKANVLTIKDVNELARWQDNVDMWEALVGHMDRMLKHMESMGPGMMGPGMGGPPSPPAEKKPE
jgi:hypothetical protein